MAILDCPNSGAAPHWQNNLPPLPTPAFQLGIDFNCETHVLFWQLEWRDAAGTFHPQAAFGPEPYSSPNVFQFGPRSYNAILPTPWRSVTVFITPA